jgi:glycogen(starch) synthase
LQVVMVVKSGVTDDARIRRIASAVAERGHVVTVIGDRPGPDLPIPGVEVRFARPPRARKGAAFHDPFRRALRWALLPNHRRRDDKAFAKAVANVAGIPDPDVLHAHDLNGLRAAQPLLRATSDLIYDSHECWTGQRHAGRPAPLIRRRDGQEEAVLGSRARYVITVSDPLADWLRDRYGWKDVVVVRNTFDALETADPEPSPKTVLYAGLIDAKRDLATVVDGLELAGVGLRVFGQGDPSTIEWLRSRGIAVEPPIPVDELTSEYRRCGIGVVSLTNNSLNHRVALPNKLFQSVQAGVPVVASDLPAIKDLVGHYGLGACFTPGDAADFAAATRTVIDDYARFHTNVLTAQTALSWPADKGLLQSCYDEIAAS